MPEIIGRGEKLAERILDFMFPGCYVLTQTPVIYWIRKFGPHFEEYTSEEHLKRTLDLVVISGEFNKDNIKMVVRIQDTKSHSGDLKSKIDSVQKGILEDIGFKVIDIHESEAKILFSNKRSWRSVWELSREINKVLTKEGNG